MLEFVKLYADMEQLFEPYSEEECGRLFLAMMAYAFSGVEPSFAGNERFIWPVLRRHIDQCNERAETLRENGSKGGRPKTKKNQTETKENQEKPNETKPNRIQEQEHIQEQEQEHKHIQEQEEIYAREETAPADDGLVLGIDGNDLSEHIAQNQLADSLILRYRLSSDDITREALIHDLGEFGEDRMREVLTEAAQSNSRERVSVKFWRAILNGKGRDSPKKDSGFGYGEVLRQREYSPDYWKSIEVNLDE